VKDLGDQLLQVFLHRNLRLPEFLLQDLFTEYVNVVCKVRFLESAQLVENDSKGPNVTLLSVGFALPDFWG
jgi:hypothetical protein